MAKIPVGATIAQAYRFAFGSFPQILGVMWIGLALMWVPGLFLQPQIMAIAAQDPGMTRSWPVLLPYYLASFILMFMGMIGIARLALGLLPRPVRYYFSLGKPVWRLIGSMLLLVLAAAIGWIAVALCAGLLGVITKLLVASTVPRWVTAIAGLAIILGLIVIWCGYFYSLVRVSFLLLPVVAAEEEGFALGNAWTRGKGNFWRMFAILLAAVLPYLLIEIAVLYEFMFKGVPFPSTPDQSAAYQLAMNAHVASLVAGMHHYWFIVYPLLLLVILLFYGTAVGAQVSAYRAVTEPEAAEGPWT